MAKFLRVSAFLTFLLAGIPLEAQTDTAAQAPWQLPPRQKSQYYASAAASEGGERVVRPRGAAGGEVVYEDEESQTGGAGCGGCGDSGCGSCGPCGPCIGCWQPFQRQLYFRGEYLMWWDKAASLPALATTSTSGTSQSQAGILGLSTTSVVAGGDSVDLGIASGARFTLGWWTTPCQDAAFEISYMFLGSRSQNNLFSSDDYSILARPFYNASTFAQDRILLAYPDSSTGWVSTSVSSELSTVEALLRHVLYRECERELDFVVGYRYGRFLESVAVGSSTDYASEVGDITMALSDAFNTKNEFHGAEIGLVAKTRYCRWSLELLAKLAMGSTQSRLNVNGSTTVTTDGGTPANYSSGMLALGTNSGDYEQTGFSVMPELGVTLGYDVTEHLRASLGYTFLYWSRVVRAADQIDTNLNESLFMDGTLSGYPAPEAKFVTSDYWAQGLNFMLEYQF